MTTVNVHAYYGCCAVCNRAPSVCGPIDTDGYCQSCQWAKEQSHIRPSRGSKVTVDFDAYVMITSDGATWPLGVWHHDNSIEIWNANRQVICIVGLEYSHYANLLKGRHEGIVIT